MNGKGIIKNKYKQTTDDLTNMKTKKNIINFPLNSPSPTIFMYAATFQNSAFSLTFYLALMAKHNTVEKIF